MSSGNKKQLLIIAGAGKGIGFSIVNEALKTNSDLHILALSRNTEQLISYKNNVTENRLIIYSLDLSDITSDQKTELQKILSGFDIKWVVFCAGVLEKQNFGAISKDLFLKIYLNNVWSFVDFTQILIPYLNKGSHIVCLGSLGGVSATQKFPGMALYSSSKAALSLISECLAEEMKDTGVSVNCLALGAVNTEMMKTAFPDYIAPVNPSDISPFIINFTLKYGKLFSGKVIPVSLNTL